MYSRGAVWLSRGQRTAPGRMSVTEGVAHAPVSYVGDMSSAEER